MLEEELVLARPKQALKRAAIQRQAHAAALRNNTRSSRLVLQQRQLAEEVALVQVDNADLRLARRHALANRALTLRNHEEVLPCIALADDVLAIIK
mgnify:CR=1 FL=1